jgi:DNA-binding MarR family transcriptional regulator
MMTDIDVDSILKDLILLLPIFHKKLLRMDLGGVPGELTRHHFAIAGMIGQGQITVSEMAKLLAMPKPQMTHLIDQLVDMEIVERHPCTEDRRVVNLALTEHGRTLFREVKQKVKENMKIRLACLTPEELTEMSHALETLRNIGARI